MARETLLPTTPAQSRGRLLQALIRERGTQEHFKRGSFVFKKGMLPRLVFIAKGTVLVAGPGLNQMRLHGLRDLLGLAECLGHPHTPKAAFAVTHVTAYILPAAELHRLVAAMPELRRHIMADLLTRQNHVE